jgi:molybdopterin/thiamine biosynthesis adenylyltransferase
VQQLAHQGLGTIIAVDNETLDETNLGRVVGATHVDIDRTRKVNLAERVATAIDPDINVVKVDKRFPSPEAIVALKTADVIVSCVDTFRAREAINLFCRRYMSAWGSKTRSGRSLRQWPGSVGFPVGAENSVSLQIGSFAEGGSGFWHS